jgi:hypothetical protein
VAAEAYHSPRSSRKKLNGGAEEPRRRFRTSCANGISIFRVGHFLTSVLPLCLFLSSFSGWLGMVCVGFGELVVTHPHSLERKEDSSLALAFSLLDSLSCVSLLSPIASLHTRGLLGAHSDAAISAPLIPLRPSSLLSPVPISRCCAFAIATRASDSLPSLAEDFRRSCG